ncbi:hypothetical protein GCM10017620_06620 [Brevundimonas intermedia]|uniref:Peptidase S9 prolyl oligopeptidase catalytic domain-containing protein n=1 Tax=Brevundimonas intermedia TaxID=74315 RepID=A0ABQ5T4J9_9CAUL|nr:prolyl oligopeptidase family serine peptidase [Brevundimonas intermedia]GLK47689.1 hypothetical protein GCM10017620_06620 [Brevundimonas intermedia]
MLTDVALKNLRSQSKPYKSTDRDGLYVYVSPGGAISFRYDYRFNGRRETLTLGRYGRGGLSLAQPLRSWLLLPAAPTSAPPPVAVIAYPGAVFPTPPARLLPGSLKLHINPALLSAVGYAVLMPSLPQRTSPSSDLDALGPELMAIVQAACAGDRCDAGRAALIGHSFGGYGALRAATQTDGFKAIIASNGYGDLSEAYEPRLYSQLSGEAGVAIQSGWLEGGQGGLGVPLGTEPLRYVERSPLYAVDKIHTPTLLIQSDFDGSRFDSIFGALYRLNREAELVTYFGQSHEFVSPANIRDLHLRILNWLERHLGAPHALNARLPAPGPNLDRTEDQEAIGRGIKPSRRSRSATTRGSGDWKKTASPATACGCWRCCKARRS